MSFFGGSDEDDGDVDDGDETGDELELAPPEPRVQLVPVGTGGAPPTLFHPSPLRAAMADELGRGVVRGGLAILPGLVVVGLGAVILYKVGKGISDWLARRGIRIVRLTPEEREEARARKARGQGPLPPKRIQVVEMREDLDEEERRERDLELAELERIEARNRVAREARLERERIAREAREHEARVREEAITGIASGTAKERAAREPFGVSVNVLTHMFADQPGGPTHILPGNVLQVQRKQRANRKRRSA